MALYVKVVLALYRPIFEAPETAVGVDVYILGEPCSVDEETFFKKGKRRLENEGEE